MSERRESGGSSGRLFDASGADREIRSGQIGCGAARVRSAPRLLGVFTAWRLQAYGYTLAAVYACAYFFAYHHRVWLVDGKGTPLFSDFAAGIWLTGRQAAHGHAALLYDPSSYIKLQKSLLGLSPSYYPNWPYPPIFLFMLVPFGLLPYAAAFLSFQAATLLGYVGVVYLIVRRRPAIAVALASPFCVSNISQGQTGFLCAALVGAALLALERQPVLAGVFIGCITFKPQLGLLLPVALIAARQWRAFVSAAVTAAVLTGLSAAAFGIGPWMQLPRELLAQGSEMLLGENPWGAQWAWMQTVYALVRALHGSAALAWLVQGSVTAGVATIVWLAWNSAARYPLKAALLSAAVLLATPYAWPHDLALIAIPVAFLAKDQIECGLLRGEQTVLIVLAGAGLASLLIGLWRFPPGPFLAIALVGLVLRRVLHDVRAFAPAVAA
jgi:arabinofuranan 3-O-arabinosyltransferase